MSCKIEINKTRSCGNIKCNENLNNIFLVKYITSNLNFTYKSEPTPPTGIIPHVVSFTFSFTCRVHSVLNSSSLSKYGHMWKMNLFYEFKSELEGSYSKNGL